jgi:SAM-dependent methyltransferase
VASILNCYACGSSENSYYFEENGFTLVKCCKCGLLYVNNPPTEFERREALSQGLHKGEEEIDVTGSFSPSKIDVYMSILGDLFGKEDLRRADWLDIGCGHGEFLLALKQFIPEPLTLRGSEPNAKKRSSAEKRGLNVGFIDIETDNNKYSHISLLNVYSHIPEPIIFLATIRSKLKVGGELILQTGDCTDLSSDDIIKPLLLPDHLSFCTESILLEILSKLGFSVVVVKKYPYIIPTPLNILKEFIKLLVPGKKSRLILWARKWRKWQSRDMYIRAKLIDSL